MRRVLDKNPRPPFFSVGTESVSFLPRSLSAETLLLRKEASRTGEFELELFDGPSRELRALEEEMREAGGREEEEVDADAAVNGCGGSRACLRSVCQSRMSDGACRRLFCSWFSACNRLNAFSLSFSSTERVPDCMVMRVDDDE